MWVKRYKKVLGKSNHGGQTLYDHTFYSVEAAVRALNVTNGLDKRATDIGVFATAVHDIGKLDPDFQKMLEAARDFPGDKSKLPKKRVKHEASTFDYDHHELVENNLQEICAEIKAVCGYTIVPDHLVGEAMDWAWAFVVSHHGLFYLSYEQGWDGIVRRCIRRKWTTFYPSEIRRITLADLLFTFHPIGGLVFLGDLMSSYAFEQQRDLAWAFKGVSNLRGAFDQLLEVEVVEKLEESIQAYDPRTYALRQTLELLAAGLNLQGGNE